MRRTIAFCWAAAMALAGEAGGAPAATRPATQPAEPVRFTLLAPTDAAAKTQGCVAVILAGARVNRSAYEPLTRTLTRKGFFLFYVRPTEGIWQASSAGRILDAVDRALADRGGVKKLLAVMTAQAGEVALRLIDRYHRRLAGAVLLSVPPLGRTPQGIDLWSPRGRAWRVPMWAVVGDRPPDAAGTLKMWRQVAAVQPQGACLTVDVRLGHGPRTAGPDEAVAKWLDAIVAGKRPQPGPDRQAQQERQLYAAAAKALRQAMDNPPAAPAGDGKEVKKREGPLEVALVPPRGWQRDPRGERKYDAEASPYVQVYLTPSPGGLLFARAAAADWSGTGADLLDDYVRRLRARGFLVVAYDRWAAKQQAGRIVSVLWPTQRRWHRWLAVMAAGAGSKDAPAAPLALVFDASAKPDAKALVSAAQTLAASLQARRTDRK